MINLIKKEINLNILLGKMINKAEDDKHIKFCFVVDSSVMMEHIRLYVACYHHDRFKFIFPSRVKVEDVFGLRFDMLCFVNQSYDKLDAKTLEVICQTINPACDNNIYHTTINYTL